MLVGHKPIHYNYSYIYLYCDWDTISLVSDKEGLSICSEASWQLWWMTSKQHRYTTDHSRLLVMVSGSVSPWSVSISIGRMNWADVNELRKGHLQITPRIDIQFIRIYPLLGACSLAPLWFQHILVTKLWGFGLGATECGNGTIAAALEARPPHQSIGRCP